MHDTCRIHVPPPSSPWKPSKSDKYHSLFLQTDKLAAGLLGLGLEPGDRLGLWGPNSSQWYLTFIAAARAGLVLVSEVQEVH